MTDPTVFVDHATLALPFKINNRILHAAATVCHKRNHCFARKVISRQKAADGRRNCSPPNRRTDKYNVVLCRIFNIFLQCRLISGTDLSFGLLRQFLIYFRISVNRFNFKQIAAKLFLCHFNRRLGSRIHSVSMQATSADSMGDAIATSAVLAGSLIGRFFEINIDGWLGVCVALVILRAGWEAARDTITPLLGTTPDPELVSSTAKTVQAHPEVIGIHDLVIHDYGPGRVMISLHAEVNANGDILTLHDAIDNIERELAAKFNCAAVIHMDPVECDDAKTNDMRQKVACLAAAIDPDITIHDFRMVTGPSHTNLIFDMVLPMDSRLTPQEARDSMEKAVSVLEGPCFAVITVDRPML